MQFVEQASTKGKCPICNKETVVRSTRGKPVYCSRACASMERFGERYQGTNSGKLDRPNLKNKIKLP